MSADKRAILVLGAAGQVGRELMQRHDPARRPLVGLARGELDIRDAPRVHEMVAALRPALVINAAAYTAVDKAEKETEAAFAVNRDGVAAIASACAAAGVPLLHISTDYVFDGAKDSPYVEDDATGPLGVYGASKLAGEEALRARLPRHIILRTAWVFGAQGANFVKTIARLAAERPELRIVDDQRGGPTPAGAIADALLAIADAVQGGAAAWGTYHFCGTPAVSWCGFAQAIVEEIAPRLGKRVPVRPIATADYPTPARRPANSRLACGKIKAAFGIEQPDWRASLPGMLDAVLAAGVA
jgi:dTDP-4-dehydrorhamnose reductase